MRIAVLGQAIPLALLLWTLAVPPGAAAEEAQDVLSIDTSNCVGPASTPACASRSWWLCQRQRDAALCAAVGVENVVFLDGYRFDASGALIYPAGAEGHLVLRSARRTHDPIAVREVGPERFQCYALDCDVPDELKATHEVMLRDAVYTSEFYRRDVDRWVLVSWTDDGLDCKYAYEFVRLDCRMRVFVAPWIRLHELGGTWRVPQFDQ